MPYRFLDDITIADAAFQAWGKTREEMFASSAEALLRTMVEEPLKVARRQELIISLEGEELDLLLFSFLQELIFHKDARRLLLHADEIRIDEKDGRLGLTAIARGEQITPDRHDLLTDVKAVTLHRFRAACEDGTWIATVVLDV